MNLISTSDYLLSISQDESMLEPLLNLQFVSNKNHDIIYYESDKSLVVKMISAETNETYSVKFLLYWDESVIERLRAISQYFENKYNLYLNPFKFHKKGLSVIQNGVLIECPVLISDWVDGITLREYLLRLSRKHATKKLQSLAYNIARMASWLNELPFAHGNISFDNIIIDTTDMLHLIDLNGAFFPLMEGEKAIETGKLGFSHPSRTQNDYGKFADDFSLLFILLTIEILVLEPELFFECESLQDIRWENKYSATGKISDIPLIKALIRRQNQFSSLYKLYINEYGSEKYNSIPEFYTLIETRILNPFCESEKIKITIPFIQKDIEKVGYIDHTKSQTITPIFDEANLFSEGLALVKIGGKRIKLTFSKEYRTFKSKCGFIDKAGNPYIPWIFDNARSFREGLAAVIYKRKSGFINNKGHVVIPFNYEYCDDFINGYAKVATGVSYFIESGDEEYLNLDCAVWGVIDKTGKKLIPIRYSDIIRDGKFYKVCGEEEFCFPNKKESGWGILDETGSKVMPFKYDGLETIFEGNGSDLNILVTNHNKVGLARIRKSMNKYYSEEVIPCSYDSLTPLSKHIIEAKFGGRLINNQDSEYDNLDNESLFKYSNTVIINYLGQIIGVYKIVPNLNYKFDDNHKLFIVTNSKSFAGVINEYGSIIIPCDYSSIKNIDDNYIIATKSFLKHDKKGGCRAIPKKIDVYNALGKLIKANFDDYERIWSKGSPIIVLCSKGKWGSLSLNGEIIHPFIFKKGINFEKEYIQVQEKNKMGIYCTQSRNIVIPCVHLEIKHLISTFFALKKASNWGVYDLALNKLIVPCSYEKIDPLVSDYLVVCKKDKYGILKIDSKSIMLTLKYDHIVHFSGSLCKVTLNNKLGLFDLASGSVLINPLYDEINIISLNISKIKIDYKCGLLDLNSCAILIDPIYDQIEQISENFFKVSNDNKWGLLDLSSKSILINPLFDEIKELSCKLLTVCVNKKWGVYTIKGKQAIFPTFDGVEILNSNRFKVYTIDSQGFDYETGHWDIIDSNNKILPQVDGFHELDDSEVVHEVYLDTNPDRNRLCWLVDKYYNQLKPPIFYQY